MDSFEDFKTGFLFVALAVMKLVTLSKLAFNSERSAYLCLPSAGIKGVRHHRPATMNFKMDNVGAVTTTTNQLLTCLWLYKSLV